MLEFRATDKRLIDAAMQIRQGNQYLSKGKKMSTAGKDFVSKWLLNERKTNIDTLPIGETVFITVDGEDCLKIDRKGPNKLDISWLQMDAPDIAARYTKPNPENRFDVLLPLDVDEASTDRQTLINATIRSLESVKSNARS